MRAQKQTQHPPLSRDFSNPQSLWSARKDLVAVSLLAFAVRLAWLRWGAWVQQDSIEYLTLARNIVFNGVFSLSGANEPLIPTAFRPPLFPAMVAALWWGDGPPEMAVPVANTLLGTLTTALIYLIALDRFDRPVAVLAGVGYALAPMTCFFTVVVLTEPLFTFLLTLGSFFWGRSRALLAGVSFGLATLTRPLLLPFLAGLVILSVFPAWRPFWRTQLTIVAVALLTASVWIVRNGMVFGRFIPIAAAGWGTNLICGSMETDISGHVWNGKEWVVLDLKTHPLTRVDGNLNDTEKDRLLMRRAFARIAGDPTHWLVVRAKQYPKLFIDNGDYLLGGRNLSLREAIRVRRWSVIALKMLFIAGNLLVIGLAVVGITLERARVVMLSHIVLLPLFGAVIHLPAWIEPRYFVPMMPLVFILAASAVARACSKRLRPVPIELGGTTC